MYNLYVLVASYECIYLYIYKGCDKICENFRKQAKNMYMS